MLGRRGRRRLVCGVRDGSWDLLLLPGRTDDGTDTHVRVDGVKEAEENANPNDEGASLLVHLAPGSTAYIENSWLSAADHGFE